MTEARHDTTMRPPAGDVDEATPDLRVPPPRMPDWLDDVLNRVAEVTARQCAAQVASYRRELFAPDGKIALLQSDVARLLNAEERRVEREEANWKLISGQVASIGSELAKLRREMGANKKRTNTAIDRLTKRVEALEGELAALKQSHGEAPLA